MVKTLTFKGDKKQKKRKRTDVTDDVEGASESTTKAANEDAADNDDSWVNAEVLSDVAGPVVIVLPTSPITCLACDANGAVFPSQVDNMVDNDPQTAEPHDVRQVWVANRVAGTQNFSLKGHHGKYLGVDKFGIPSATREAISPEEGLSFVPSPDCPGMFSLQTHRDKFLTVVEEEKKRMHPEIRGDADVVGFSSSFRIRMQARFKPRLKANREEKAREKISRKQLEEAAGRRLEDEEVKRLKKARREGSYHEALLDLKVKGKHDKFA